ncbi:hypothetical protein, conserved, partial [Trypanosoma cruzi]
RFRKSGHMPIWMNRSQNDAFEELSLAATDVFVEDPRYETKVAEAVEADVQQITQLTDLVLQDTKPLQLARKKGTSAAKSIGVDITKRRKKSKKSPDRVPLHKPTVLRAGSPETRI